MRVKTDSMRLAFHNANKAVAQVAPNAMTQMGIDHKTLWEETHRVKIIQGPWGDWQEIEFASDADFTAFMLRWS